MWPESVPSASVFESCEHASEKAASHAKYDAVASDVARVSHSCKAPIDDTDATSRCSFEIHATASTLPSMAVCDKVDTAASVSRSLARCFERTTTYT